jgi:acetolactate synthase-1/2/3 large subunit
VVQVPLDVLAEKDDVSPLPPAPVERRGADAEGVSRAAELLAGAQRPVIWAGGGVNISGANEALRRVAEQLSAPVIVTPDGKGAIPEDHPLSLGNSSGEGPVLELLRKSDACLAVGTRFQQRIMRNWRLPLPAAMVRIDVDPAELDKNYPPTIGLAGDARLTLEALAGHLPDRAPRPEVLEEVRAIRERIAAYLREHAAPEAEMMDVLRQKLAPDVVVFSDTARGSGWVRQSFPVYSPRSCFTPGGFSTLGFAVPAAMGAQAAYPGRQVCAVVGDGSFMFTCNELGTAVQENLPLNILLFNNKAHQGIKDHQVAECEGRVIAADLVQPDFVKFAECFGALGLRVEKLDELGPALDEARESRKPAIVEIAFDVQRPPRVP